MHHFCGPLSKTLEEFEDKHRPTQKRLKELLVIQDFLDAPTHACCLRNALSSLVVLVPDGNIIRNISAPPDGADSLVVHCIIKHSLALFLSPAAPATPTSVPSLVRELGPWNYDANLNIAR